MIKYDDSPKPSEPLVLHDARLELPDGRDFEPVLRRAAPAGFIEFCASYLPKFRQRPDYRQRRFEKSSVLEFDLQYPERVKPSYPKDFLQDLVPF
jgi:hypothetical protein